MCYLFTFCEKLRFWHKRHFPFLFFFYFSQVLPCFLVVFFHRISFRLLTSETHYSAICVCGQKTICIIKIPLCPSFSSYCQQKEALPHFQNDLAGSLNFLSIAEKRKTTSSEAWSWILSISVFEPNLLAHVLASVSLQFIDTKQTQNTLQIRSFVLPIGIPFFLLLHEKPGHIYRQGVFFNQKISQHTKKETYGFLFVVPLFLLRTWVFLPETSSRSLFHLWIAKATTRLHMCRLAGAFAGRLCDKYTFLISWLK